MEGITRELRSHYLRVCGILSFIRQDVVLPDPELSEYTGQLELSQKVHPNDVFLGTMMNPNG